MNNASLWIIENWSTIVSISAFLSVGYVTMRKFERILGKDSKGRTIADRLDHVEHQLFPNGGSSLADKVNDLTEDHREAKATIKEMNASMQVIHDVLIAYIKDK